MRLFVCTHSHTMPRAPHGGALAVVLLFVTLISLCLLPFVMTVRTASTDAAQYVYVAACDAGIESAVAHASYLLHTDLHTTAYDAPTDIWVTYPRGERLRDRNAWEDYLRDVDVLDDQQWFDLPGPTPTTRVRYRMKIVDATPSANGWEHTQPWTPAVWHNGQWQPAHDVNTLSRDDIASALETFDSRGTSTVWRTQTATHIVDDRDANTTLYDVSFPFTEALKIDLAAHGNRIHWHPVDDRMRVGRYYEMRPNHNFFVVDNAQTTHAGQVRVTLSENPLMPIDGWNEYTALRSRMRAPRWPAQLFDGTPAATGSGDHYKEQRIIHTTADAWYFHDTHLPRYENTGGIQQTVTLRGWFSSLNTWMRAWTPQAKERGVFVTTTPGVSDTIYLRDVPEERPFRVSSVVGYRYAQDTRMQLGAHEYSALRDATIDMYGVAVPDASTLVRVAPRTHEGTLEVFFRAPSSGVSPAQPFFLEGFMREEPEFIIVHNRSDTPLSLRDYRLGMRIGDVYHWTAPFTTAYWSRATHDNATDTPIASPHIPAHSTAIITPDAALFDMFYGTLRHTNARTENADDTVLIETGWETWGPRFAVERARPGRVTTAYGSCSFRLHEWSTEWRLAVSALRDVSKLHTLTNEMVFFFPEGPDSDIAPVPGVVTEARRGFLTIRFNGGRNKFTPNRHAVVQFRGVPRAVDAYVIATPDGLPAAYLPVPPQRDIETTQPTARIHDPLHGTREIPFSDTLLRTRVRPHKIHRYDTPPVRNRVYSSHAEKLSALEAHGVDTSTEWFLPQTYYRPFSSAIHLGSTSLDAIPDTHELTRVEGAHFTRNGAAVPSPFFSEGTPGLLYATLYTEAPEIPPLSINRIASDGIRVYTPRHIPRSQRAHHTLKAVCGPDPDGGGIHLMGTPGIIECEWQDIPSATRPFEITLAGRAARRWSPPHTAAQWHLGTNTPVRVSVDIWHPPTRRYTRRVTKASFDGSDRLALGVCDPSYLHNGRLRLRIHTYDELRPGHTEIWLGGVYLSSLSSRQYVNINTAPLSVLQAVSSLPPPFVHAGRNGNNGIRIFENYSTLLDAYDTLATPHTVPNTFSTRSDIFTVVIEAEVIAATETHRAETDAEPYARRRATYILSRDESRLDPIKPLHRTPTTIHVTAVDN